MGIFGADGSRINLLGAGGVFNFSLKDSRSLGGKVWPFSHISTSFLIFSYTTKCLSESLFQDGDAMGKSKRIVKR
jgi:hypothetical protein